MPPLQLPRAPRPLAARKGRLSAFTQVENVPQAPQARAAALARPAGRGPRVNRWTDREAVADDNRPMANIAPVGEPQVLTEPARVVTASGRTVATLGEGVDEELTIRPVRARPGSRRGDGKIPGVRGYATGGTITVQNIKDQPRGTAITQSGVTIVSGGDGKTYSPSSFQSTYPGVSINYASGSSSSGSGSSGNVVVNGVSYAPLAPNPSQGAAPAPSSSYGAAGQAIYDAQGAVLDARQADINANRGVTAAQQAEINAGRAYIDAQGRVLDAQGRELDAQGRVISAQRNELAASRAALGSSREYLEEQQRASEASRAEEEAIQAAAANVADKTAVARAQTARNDEDYKFDVGGISRPTEITEPTGGAENPAAPGVRSKLRTQEELLAEKASNARALRAFDVEDARLAAQDANITAQAAGLDVSGARIDLAAAGIDTSRAQIAASRANLNVQRANLNTSAARNNAANAGLDVSQANLNLDIASRPPAPGMVLDSQTGNWVSEAQFRILQAQRGIEYDPINKLFVPRQELLDRTDAAGNVLRLSDNTWVDPKTGNELINGTWTDPKTGNVLLPNKEQGMDVWLAPNGNKFFVENPNTGAGYWKNPDGFVLMANGIWRHPVTGDYIVDGVLYHEGGGGSLNLDLSGLLGGGSTGSSSSSSQAFTPTLEDAPVFTNPLNGSPITGGGIPRPAAADRLQNLQ